MTSVYDPNTYAKYAAENDQYAGLLSGDSKQVEQHAVLDPAYADEVGRNVRDHLRILDLPPAGGVVDIGSGAGGITAALHKYLRRRTFGFEAHPSAVEYAKRTHPGPEFDCRSAHDLSGVDDGSAALIFARGFYPFCRERDTDLHMQFLEPGFAKLAPGGIFAISQIRYTTAPGIHNNLSEVRRRTRALGYAEDGVMVMAPQFLYRRMAAVLFNPPARAALTLFGHALERVRPGKVSYLYWFKKPR